HRTIINKNGKPSQTDFQLISTHAKFSWIKALPISGRTHQIRVHLQHCGLPIVCDSLYNQYSKPLFLSSFKKNWRGDSFEEKPLLNRLALHAHQIEFSHPTTKQNMIFTADYPKDLAAIKKQLK
ncbi:MAG: pseudouridine synthase, partial [Treponemataceae bacterium]